MCLHENRWSFYMKTGRITTKRYEFIENIFFHRRRRQFRIYFYRPLRLLSPTFGMAKRMVEKNHPTRAHAGNDKNEPSR